MVRSVRTCPLLQSTALGWPHVHDVVSVGLGPTDAVDEIVRLEGIVLVAHLHLIPVLFGHWFRLWSVHEEHRNEEQQRTDTVESSVEEHNRASVAERLGQRVHQNGQIATDVVHHKQEHSDGRRTDLQWDDFNQYGKHNSKPHFGEEVTDSESDHRPKWFEVDGSESERSSNQLANGQTGNT